MSDNDVVYLWSCVSCCLVANIIGVIAQVESFMMSTRLGLQIRNSIISLVFQKIMTIHPTIRQANTGRISNIIVSDAQEFQDCFVKLMPSLFAPLDAMISIFLLYLETGLSIFVIIGYVIVTFALVIVVVVICCPPTSNNNNNNNNNNLRRGETKAR